MAKKISTRVAQAGACLAAAIAGLTPALASDKYTYDIVKYTHGGNAIRVVSVLSVKPDCTPNKVTHRIVTLPKNGTLAVEATDAFGHWSTTPRDKCNEKPIPGLVATYTPNEGFVGQDYIEMQGFDDAGIRQTYKVKITVEK